MAAQNSLYMNELQNEDSNDSMSTMDMDYEEMIMMLDSLSQPAMNSPHEAEQITRVLVADENSQYKGYWSRIRDLYHNTMNAVVKEAITAHCRRMNQTPFNVTFREQLADVIETTAWNVFTEHDEYLASYIIDNFINKIKTLSQIHVQGNMMSEVEFNGWKTELEKYYRNNSMDFIRSMKQNLDTESHIMQIATQAPKMEPLSPQAQTGASHGYQNGNEVSSTQYEIQKRLQIFEKMKGDIIDKFSMQLVPMEKNLVVITRGNLVFWDRANPVEYSTWNANAKKNYDDVKNGREKLMIVKEEIAQNLDSHADQSFSLLEQIIFQIKRWQRMKAYENNGKLQPDACNIETLSIWCNGFVRILAECYNLSQTLITMTMLDLPNMRDQRMASIMRTIAKFEGMIKDAIANSLVIEKHPPQVLMRDKKFQCQLRLLIGDALDIHSRSGFSCEAKLVTDIEHERLKTEGVHTKISACGKINNNLIKSEFQEQSKHVQVCMRSMSLHMKQRGDRRNAEVVAEEKFCMIFRANIFTNFFSGNNTAQIISQVFSLPIVVISHGKQEPDAQATIFWDNAFSEMDRKNFDVRKNVLWSQLLADLNCRWQKDCGLGLSLEAQEFLTMKFFNCQKISSNECLDWSKFNKDQTCCGSDRMAFTFWTWFYRIMELVRHKHLRNYWNDELIHGFLTKQACMEKLLATNIKVGTFLFRFSESMLGAISIACKEKNGLGEVVVKHYEPDTLKGLEVLSLAKTVLDLAGLQYFYPGRPKIEVFEKYLTKPNQIMPSRDYVRKELTVKEHHQK